MKFEFEFKKKTDQQTLDAVKEILKFSLENTDFNDELMKILFNQTAKKLLEKLEKRKKSKVILLNLSLLELIILRSILPILEINEPYKYETILLKQLLY